jgi:hemolysin activation/secretion protein
MNPAKCCTIAVAAMAMLCASLPARAQIPGSDLPGRDRQRFEQPPAPLAQPGGPRIALPSTVAPPGADKITLTLAHVVITGSTVYRPQDFDPLYADLIGHTITLAAVYDIAARITAKYGADGYVLSRAIVPPQELSPGGATIRLQVIEGYVDRVEWPPALSKYRDFFSYYADRIIADRPANIRTLERYLLLAGDLPGLKFKNSLKPSATNQAAATLVVEVVEKPIDAQARFDNRGTRARGPFEYYGSATLNNMLRIHDAFTITYAGVPQTRELQYLYGQYRQFLTPEGLSAFIDGGISGGHPGLPVPPILNYRTKSTFGDAGVTYPFIRQRERNLSATALFFASNDRADDQIQGLDSDIRLRGVRVKIDADAADPWGGINQLNLTGSHGFNGLGASATGFVIRPNAPLDYTKFEGTFTRVQSLPAQFSALFAAYGQYGLNPLFTPEQCGYGGRVFGRAYDPSEIISDSCVELLGELRWDVPSLFKDINLFQFYGYGDRGWLHNHNPAPVLGTATSVDAASVGGGIRLGWQSPFTTFGSLTADLSANKAVEGPRDDWRFFFIVTGRY